jgi:hypothetical protein
MLGLPSLPTSQNSRYEPVSGDPIDLRSRPKERRSQKEHQQAPRIQLRETGSAWLSWQLNRRVHSRRLRVPEILITPFPEILITSLPENLTG